jgi:hypothetical protein
MARPGFEHTFLRGSWADVVYDFNLLLRGADADVVEDVQRFAARCDG